MNRSNSKKNEIKCVVWDLDNTIWNGIILENDDVQLRPGMKRIIQELDFRGILHSIASRSHFDLSDKKLREFGLDKYFIYPEINWNAKSDSISRIQQNLNIAMNAFMFVDDNPFEREEVLQSHPEITCIDAAECDFLLDDPRLNPKFITKDSSKRREMYQQNIKRKLEEDEFKGPRADFLASLNMRLSIANAREEDLQRAEELTVRTNQLNTTGKPYSYSELKALMDSPAHHILTCELSDKFGTHGKIGLALIEEKPDFWHLNLFLMSCRVMPYGVGSVFLTYIMSQAKKSGKKLLVDFFKTDRNRMMYITFKFANFKETIKGESGNIILEHDLSVIHNLPQYVEIIV